MGRAVGEWVLSDCIEMDCLAVGFWMVGFAVVGAIGSGMTFVIVTSRWRRRGSATAPRG